MSTDAERKNGKRQAAKQRRVCREIVAEELAARGGTCEVPGCDETEVEWHHRDPTVKDFKISGLRKPALVRAELAKCVALCPTPIGPNTSLSFRPGCGCARCRTCRWLFY